MNDVAQALVYCAPGEARIDTVDLPPQGIRVMTRFSGISRGTERLIFNGLVPEAEHDRMRAPLQSGDFPFPVRYGYAATGTVDDPTTDLHGREVFCLHPHQTAFRAPQAMVLPIPRNVPASRAILAANMETALNAIWDARLRPGSKCLVVGAGLLGWLITALLSRRPDLSVDITDIRTDTGVKADDFSVNFMTPDRTNSCSYDVAFHTSASSAGLQSALDALNFEGRVIELSWYGVRETQINLGGNFHANRLSILCSQVGHVAPTHRHAVTHRDRLARALTALDDPRLDLLITHEVHFRDLPESLPRLLADDAPGIATRIVYD